ncbi:hypothetical protein AB0K68_13820 [Streptomyces sp. NPDC050698]
MRKLSCSVALAVAGAMAAVTIGSVFVFDLLPGRGGQDDADSGSGSDSPPAASASSAGEVPAAYVGTWEGPGRRPRRRTVPRHVPHHRRTGSDGQELGRLRQTDQIGGVCVDVLTLKQVTDKELVATSAGAKTNHGPAAQLDEQG